MANLRIEKNTETRSNLVGGLLLYNSSYWTAIGQYSLVSNQISAVIPISSTEFYVIGDITTIKGKANVPYYNTALCNIYTGCVGPVGQGIFLFVAILIF